MLERLIIQLQEQVTTLKYQLDKKDGVINTLLEKLEKKEHEESSPSRATKNGSSIIQTSPIIQATFVKTQHGNINMNQESSINNIPTAQNITQGITTQTFHQHVKKTQKTNPILKMNLILSA